MLSNKIDSFEELGFSRQNKEKVVAVDHCAWSEAVSKSLGLIDSPYVFLWLEDLFLTSGVDNKKISCVIAEAIRRNVDYLSLSAKPLPPRPYEMLGDVGVGRLPEGMLYRASTVMTLWRKEVLRLILKNDEGPWAFELRGFVRTAPYKHFYSTTTNILPHENCVIKGKWTIAARNRTLNLGLGEKEISRPVMNLKESILYTGAKIRSSALGKLPVLLRAPIRRLFRAS